MFPTGIYCGGCFRFERLSQFGRALPAQNLALPFPAEPGFVTISCRHSFLPHGVGVQVESETLRANMAICVWMAF
jgi:hypothetical protein